MRTIHGLTALSTLLAACGAASPDAEQTRWLKGNTHTHTLWSDGDGAPEQVAAWYADNGYQFLVLSDHNTYQDHERWFPVAEDGVGRLKPSEVDALITRFGAQSVDLRGEPGDREMRLRTLDELKAQVEVTPTGGAGGFLLLPGEEVTSSFQGKPVHINAVNTDGVLPALERASIVELMTDTMRSIEEAGAASGRPVFGHLNHPNFGWGVTWEEVAAVKEDRFFEVYNGHRSTRNEGDSEHPSTEDLWDRALARRLGELGGLPLLYGVATDDAHHYYGNLTSPTGRGWVMVRATSLDRDAVTEAMNRGDFYASSGVTLKDLEVSDEAYRLEVEADEGVTYRIRFIGTRQLDGALGTVGEELAATDGPAAEYRFKGDELYVRAQVTSSRLHPKPYLEGDREMAWTQPATPSAR
ncbi:MAG: hypothetical protein P8M11_02485 [Planctomycetota bacterium]|nr:hypothetical protein [Planctomycetota bacterium]MDG1983409.1 hypothetical protein [Planctomycetota bacterium]